MAASVNIARYGQFGEMWPTVEVPLPVNIGVPSGHTDAVVRKALQSSDMQHDDFK